MRRRAFGALGRSFKALPETQSKRAAVEAPIKGVLDTAMEETYIVGAGASALPFSKEHVRSRSSATASVRTSILSTATVLDIGGQDTRRFRSLTGIVESFQMNDRCTRRLCRRYLATSPTR
ncbi:MAG: BadF/BadG/BcrA/BcrD ATPase family protein [Rubrivivax sp.]